MIIYDKSKICFAGMAESMRILQESARRVDGDDLAPRVHSGGTSGKDTAILVWITSIYFWSTAFRAITDTCWHQYYL